MATPAEAPYRLDQAQVWAERVREKLAAVCPTARIEIAGSIRRRRPWVNDLDFVILANEQERPTLLHRLRSWATVIHRHSPNMMECEVNRVQLDVWFADPEWTDLAGVHPSNWGTLLLCRTGSKQFNVWLCAQAHARGLHWNPNHGVFAGPEAGKTLLACETEAAVLAALGVPWIPPEEREK